MPFRNFFVETKFPILKKYVLKEKCPKCGGAISGDIDYLLISCPHCGCQIKIKEDVTVIERILGILCLIISIGIGIGFVLICSILFAPRYEGVFLIVGYIAFYVACRIISNIMKLYVPKHPRITRIVVEDGQDTSLCPTNNQPSNKKELRKLKESKELKEGEETERPEGEGLEIRCPECGDGIPAKKEICPHCGYPILLKIQLGEKVNYDPKLEGDFYISATGGEQTAYYLKAFTEIYKKKNMELGSIFFPFLLVSLS